MASGELEHTLLLKVTPESVVNKMHHQILHGQTALLVKRHLLFERES
jgi:hypothetical protein